MKKIIFIAFFGLIAISCSNSDDANNNQYLPDLNFDTGATINTNFSQYGSLVHPGNHIIINEFGLNGIVVFYTGSSYLAFELSDPNHALQSCSKLIIEGDTGTCGCVDGKQYHIITGQQLEGTTGQYTLKQYFTEVNGTIIRVYNN